MTLLHKKKTGFQRKSSLYSKKSSNTWLEYFKAAAIALFLALLIRSCLMEPFKIPSGSMIPNLLIGDYILVSKYQYGYGPYSTFLGPYSSFLKMPLNRRILASQPERGDIVVIHATKGEKRNYIKRLIGLPGEEIKIVRGIVHINGVPVERKKIRSDSCLNRYSEDCIREEYEETLPNGKSYSVLYELKEGDDQDSFPDTTYTYLVPEGFYFFMGDNRNHSVDSRFIDNIGFVPDLNIIGKALVVIWNSNLTFQKMFGGQFNEIRMFVDLACSDK